MAVRCLWFVIGQGEACETAVQESRTAFEQLFRAHHNRIVRVITRVIQDPGRAEEVAVEVFWKFWRTPKAQGCSASGWLHRTAIRMSLNELRRQLRSARRERQAVVEAELHSPEKQAAAIEEQERVRRVLNAIKPRDAELLLLRSSGLTYEQAAAALRLNPSSMGTLLARAQAAFRKEYLKQYGDKR